MVTVESPGHGAFEELAAGYTLDALEPGDERRFLHHASQCRDCAHTLAGFREVAAALASIAPPAEPRPQLAERIMAAAQADLGRGQPAAAPARTDVTRLKGASGIRHNVVPLRPRARKWLRPAAAAAAALLIAGGGTWAGLDATTGTSPKPSVAGCAHERGCLEVTLTAASTHHEAATVLVQDGVVWMVPATMNADDTVNEIYVLWQITGSNRPLAVGSFDVRAGAHAPIRIGGLAAPSAGTLAFAVSLEHGRTIPAAPSRIAALGQVS